jgi:hypothetical protein
MFVMETMFVMSMVVVVGVYVLWQALWVSILLLIGWIRFKYFVDWVTYMTLAQERPIIHLHPDAEVYRARGFGFGPEEYYRDWAHCCRLKQNFFSLNPKRVPLRIISFTPKQFVLMTTEVAKKTSPNMFECPSGNGYIFGKLFPKNTTITLEYNMLSDEYENENIYYDPPNDWTNSSNNDNSFYKEINVPLAITRTEVFRQLNNRPYNPCTCDW